MILPKLHLGRGNVKISDAIYTFSLPAGFTCPFAKECLSKANRFTGKIIDGKHCKFRCFAATQECRFPSIRKSRWANFDLLKGKSLADMAGLIQYSLPQGIGMVRVHISGDFFKESYFLAWLNIALNRPETVFYGYTKATKYLVKYKKHIPHNFRFTASKGGTCDNLIAKHKLKSVEVVYSIAEAEQKGLELDHDDSHAYSGKDSFALLIHSTQPEGSLAAKAWKSLITQGIGGYNQAKKDAKNTSDVQIYIRESGSVKYFPSLGRKVFA